VPLLKSINIEGFMRGQHFISIAMEMHVTPERDMDRVIKECALFSTINN